MLLIGWAFARNRSSLGFSKSAERGREEMKDLVGRPGSVSGLVLRLGQCAFAASAIGVMVGALGFSTFTAFWYFLFLFHLFVFLIKFLLFYLSYNCTREKSVLSAWPHVWSLPFGLQSRIERFLLFNSSCFWRDGLLMMLYNSIFGVNLNLFRNPIDALNGFKVCEASIERKEYWLLTGVICWPISASSVDLEWKKK